MHVIAIDGVRPFDGRYDIDLSGASFTTHEWGIIKKYAGYYMGDYEEGFARVDVELVVACAVVALAQAGKITPPEYGAAFDRLASVPFDGAKISVEVPDEAAEDDADPPPQPSETNSTESGDTSAPDSLTSSDSPTDTPNGSGTPDSVSSVSVPTRLVS